MNDIRIEKKANCYTVEVNQDWHSGESEDEVFFYKTKEEMVAALPELVERAHAKAAEDKAAKEAKEAAKKA